MRISIATKVFLGFVAVLLTSGALSIFGGAGEREVACRDEAQAGADPVHPHDAEDGERAARQQHGDEPEEHLGGDGDPHGERQTSRRRRSSARR